MSEKKVIAVIVEGPSEEAALGSILKEHFTTEEVQFVVVHGDITTKDYTSVEKFPRMGWQFKEHLKRPGNSYRKISIL